MWALFGSWTFVLLLVAVAAGGLLALCWGKTMATAVAAAAAFLVASGVLVMLLVSPTTLDEGVTCGGTVPSTQIEPLDDMTAEDLVAQGAEDYNDDCRAAARLRFGLVVGTYAIVLAAIAVAITTQGSPRRQRSSSV